MGDEPELKYWVFLKVKDTSLAFDDEYILGHDHVRDTDG